MPDSHAMNVPSIDVHLPRSVPEFGHPTAALFGLDPAIRYLNHGGYGAAPLAVLAVQDAWRRTIEANPTRYLVVDQLGPRLRQVAEAVARRLGGEGQDWTFVANATDGANAVMGSLRLAPGDEILLTDHGYNALRQTALHVAARAGAEVRTVSLPWPDASADAILAAITLALRPRTRLLVIDHISSPTSLVLPVARIAAAARAAGVPLLVDGAHVPGHLALDVPSLGADWYIGNLHKWAFVPRGCGVLWSRRALQAELHPTVISHGYGQCYTTEFDWQGTRDFSGVLSVPAAFDFADRLGGFDAIAAYNHALVANFAERLHAMLGTNQSTPAGLRGFSTTVALPARLAATPETARALRQRLFERHGVVAPIFPLAGRLWLRVQAQVYLEADDLPAAIAEVFS
jgi:isopenicillin-N epimerase